MFSIILFSQSKIHTSINYPGQGVDMWQQAEISRLEGGSRKSIYTFGLGGCIALALITRCRNGDRHAMMSHYPPINRQDQIMGLKRAHNRFKYLCNGEVEKEDLIVVVPEEYEKASDGSRHTVTGEKEHLRNLGNVVNLEPQVSTYSGFRFDRKTINDPEWVPNFEVILDENAAIWKSFGDGHIPHPLD